MEFNDLTPDQKTELKVLMRTREDDIDRKITDRSAAAFAEIARVREMPADEQLPLMHTIMGNLVREVTDIYNGR